jgi:catechol 2,3-dioxygenase-like lactoylglutathione lyase family enzyme
MLAMRRTYATIPAADMARAMDWYRDKLGIEPVRHEEYGAVYRLANGCGFLLYPTPNAGQAPNTLMAFEATDVQADVRELRSRGVQFENYDMPGLKTVDGIAEMNGYYGAWFKDSEGNILAIGNEPF